MTAMNCETCQTGEAVGVYSSGWGALSLAFCRECLQQTAEPLGVILAGIWCAGGLEQLAHCFTGQRSFRRGRYIEWSEIVALYPDYELKSNQEFREYLSNQPETEDEEFESAF